MTDAAPGVPKDRFEKTVLPNGVRIVTESIPSVRSVAVGLWVETGSRDEAPEEAGISHFIEHMVFKGTTRRKMHHIAQRLESVGGYLNAFTTKEYTCFYARALDEHLARSIDLLVDLVLHPTIPEKEMEKEKDVVIEEMKMYEDAPEDLVFDFFEGQVYEGHTLGRPVIGFPESVRAFTRDQLMDYLDRRYAPNRVVLAVAGNVRHEEVVRLAARLFHDTSRQVGEQHRDPLVAYTPADVDRTRPIQQAHLVLGTRGFSILNPQRSVVSVMNTLLGGGMSSRLNQNIRERYGYCYNIYSFANMHSDTGDFGVYMGTDASKIPHARKLILRELDRFVQNPLSERVVAQGKNQVKGAIMLGLESMSNRMMRLARQEIYFGRFFSLDEVIEEIEAVNSENLLEISRQLMAPERFSTVVLRPES